MIDYLEMNPTQLLNGLLDFNSLTYIQKGHIIRFIKSHRAARYQHKMGANEYDSFMKSRDILWSCFASLLHICSNNDTRIVPYDGQWRNGNLFDYNKLNNRQTIIKTNDSDVIKEIFEMSLKYYSFPIFVSSERDIAVIPTDHLDLFVANKEGVNASQSVISPYLEIAEWGK